MQDTLSYDSIRPHLKNLRFCGFYQLDSKSSNKYKLIHKIYMRLILFLILLYTLQQIIKVYQDIEDVNKVMDTMFLLLTNSDCIYKQVVLLQNATGIEELLDIMKGPIFNQNKPKHHEILYRTLRKARLLLRSFNNVAIFTCLLWVLYPTMLHLQRKPVEFAIWLPFDVNLNPQFYVAAFYVWLQTSWLAYNNTTMDAFISTFLAQCKTQLSILRLELENITVKSVEESKTGKFSFNNIYQIRFRKILMHYNEIIRFSDKIQAIFGGAVLYQFLIGAWIICTTAYRIVSINLISVEFVSMTMYMLCILTELFLYCYYGNEVTYESEMLLQSAYAMDWHRISLRDQRVLIIFMERAKRTIEPVAGVLIPLSNNTFVSILRNSYTFYAFLKNTN